MWDCDVANFFAPNPPRMARMHDPIVSKLPLAARDNTPLRRWAVAVTGYFFPRNGRASGLRGGGSEMSKGIADTNVSGRVQVSLAVPTHIIRKIIAPHTSVIREYLELKHYCHILAVHGIKSGVPKKQGLHRDYLHARKVLVLAVATHDCPISTQFVPRSHRGLEDRGVTSACTRTDQAVLYDAAVLHCGSAEISPYRLFIFIAKLNDNDDFVSLATECSEYNPRFSFYPVPIFFDESAQTCP